jgi:hypothetical protein
MNVLSNGEGSIGHYYVDEAGDTTLFSRRGRVIIGEEGCSTYFCLGLLDVPNPDQLSENLEKLRQDLLSDPYFRKVPSMQVRNRKTAFAFHAKDDPPEVRREVFALLRESSNLRFFAVIKDKRKEIDYIMEQQKSEPTYRYQPNQLYEYLVSRMFTGHLHEASEYNICFAKRGKADRTESLRQALETARQKSKMRGTVASAGLMNVTTLNSSQHCALQAVDYFLWSLQRFYEKREDRYVDYLWSAFRVVIDVDDKRHNGSGVFYTQKNPLTLAGLPVESI